MARGELRRALDIDVGMYSHLHAGVVVGRRWHELVAGNCHHFPGQPDRSGSNAS